MKRGTVFEHKYWLDAKNIPLLCAVTAVRDGVVYWTHWEPGEFKKHGKWYFDIDDMHKHVGQIINEPSEVA